MGSKNSIVILLIAVTLVAILVLTSQEASAQTSDILYSPAPDAGLVPSPEGKPETNSLPETNMSLPEPVIADAPPTTGGTAEEIRDGIVADFNTRYGNDLEPPAITFINESRGKYEKGTIYIPYASQYAIAHETCHYFQDKTCSFESYGESFCEVFAGADRGKDECAEGGWPAYYCTPFRLSEVDRQGFVDCVFEKACASGGATKDELMSCYNKNKK